MPLEAVTYISDFNILNPVEGDPKSEGDDHIRNLKTGIKTTFPNVAGAVTPTHTVLNYMLGVTSAVQTQFTNIQTNIDAKGAHAGQTWTGTHSFTGATITVPTAAVGTSSTVAASTAFAAALAFSSALPAISAGTNGRLISNDGLTAFWTSTVSAESFFHME